MLRPCHDGVARGSPAIALTQPAHDAVGRILVPGYAVFATPAHHLAIACEGPPVAGFFVRAQLEATEFALQLRQY